MARIVESHIVEPKYYEGWNTSLLGAFGVGPKFTIVCGKCSCTFQKRVPIIDYPTIPCPHCNVLNRLPVHVL